MTPELWPFWLWIEFFYVLCITSALALGMQEANREIPARDDRGLRLGAGLAEAGETGIAYTLFLLFPSALPWLASLWIVVLAVTETGEPANCTPSSTRISLHTAPLPTRSGPELRLSKATARGARQIRRPEAGTRSPQPQAKSPIHGHRRPR